MAAIYITDAEGKVQRHEFETDDVLMLGSGEDCDIRIEGTEGVAAQHCELLWDEGFYILNTCTDELKVKVNDESLDCVALVPQVEYYIGSACLLFMASDEDEQEYLESGEELEEDAEAEEETPEPEELEQAGAPRLTRQTAAPARLKKKPVPGAPRKKKQRPRTVMRRKKTGSAHQMRSAALRSSRTVVRPVAKVRPAAKVKPRVRSAAEQTEAVDFYAMESEESEGADFVMSLIKPLYVVAVLVFAFIAGLTVHHLIVTGQFYPTSSVRPADSSH